jgi:hypothetical protein
LLQVLDREEVEDEELDADADAAGDDDMEAFIEGDEEDEEEEEEVRLQHCCFTFVCYAVWHSVHAAGHSDVMC